MKSVRGSLLACCAVYLIAPSTASAQPLPMKTVEFDSPSVGRKMKYNIVLPAKYDQGEQRFPVLYLLHGFTNNYTEWGKQGIPSYVRAYDLIVVMPDGGNSWYVNWAKSEDGQKNNWEDAIIKDLVGHVDSTYRTIAKREGRAINGLSMGGFGGLMLGLRHPDMFCSIGSHSGALSMRSRPMTALRAARRFRRKQARSRPSANPAIGIEGFSSQAERSPKGQMFDSAENAAAHDPFQLVLKVPRDKLPHIYLDCGTEDGLIKYSKAFAQLLMEKNIPFTYGQSPGAHNAAYWTREVGESMAVQYAIIQRHLAPVKAGGGKKKDESLDAGQLVGSWQYVLGIKDGEKLDIERIKQQDVIITKDTFTLKHPDGTFVMKYALDAKKTPVGSQAGNHRRSIWNGHDGGGDHRTQGG